MLRPYGELNGTKPISLGCVQFEPELLRVGWFARHVLLEAWAASLNWVSPPARECLRDVRLFVDEVQIPQ